MRPRVFPAEDVEHLSHQATDQAASMRPRVFPAEDSDDRRQRPCSAQVASMRPRVFPAEDIARCSASRTLIRSFNEAAGIPRGRLSARPSLTGSSSTGFNEAAGIPRGRPESH